MSIRIKNGQTILFIGDSITDCGRRAEERPLGNGYVKLFADLVTIREPAKQIRIINKGIGGERVTDLANRWTDDVLRHKPDWLSVKIGINDLHSHLRQSPDSVSPALHRKRYDEILARTRAALPKCRILLIEPFYISTDGSPNGWRRQVMDLMPPYLSSVRAMSRKYDAGLVRTHDLFQKLLKHHEAETFCPEPVHPHLTGHLAIAEAVYDTLS